MKKFIIYSITVLVLLLNSPAYSQEIAANGKKEKTFTTAEKKEQQVEIRYINDVNGKVLRSFHQSFGEKPDAQWSRTDKGFVVCFKENSISTNVYFMCDGTVDYRVNYYSEAQLPRAVRHIVKSSFYDYSITQVSEVRKDDVVNYFVKAEDKASIITIRVVGDEWKIMESIIKQ